MREQGRLPSARTRRRARLPCAAAGPRPDGADIGLYAGSDSGGPVNGAGGRPDPRPAPAPGWSLGQSSVGAAEAAFFAVVFFAAVFFVVVFFVAVFFAAVAFLAGAFLAGAFFAVFFFAGPLARFSASSS